MPSLWLVVIVCFQHAGLRVSGADAPLVVVAAADADVSAPPAAAPQPYPRQLQSFDSEPAANSGNPSGSKHGPSGSSASHTGALPEDCNDVEHVHVQVVLYYMIVALAVGMITYHLLDLLEYLYHISIPYTVTVFVEGLLLGLAHFKWKVFQIFPGSWAGWDHGPFPCAMHFSIDMWCNIDSHLLLFVFLPILLTGDSMSLNWSVLKGCLSQCLLLATLGVAIGAGLTACAAKFFLPYNWGWWTCLTFGSILSATDPVAVVGLLKDLGCSKVITMQIAGESLFNDGTAMVFFNIAVGFMRHELDASVPDPTTWDTIRLIIQLPLGAALMGIALGTFLCYCITKTQNKFVHSNHVLQLGLPLVVAYWGYYLGDWEFQVSGVITTIVAAFCFGRASWPLVIDPHGMHAFWHMLEFFGNTLIFFLAGTLFARSMFHKDWHGFQTPEVKFTDYGYCFLMYMVALVVRTIMIILLYPLLAGIGMGTNPKDATVMVWGGLRGAVGLALAIAIDVEFGRSVGPQFIFIIGGVAFLTLVINATTCGALVTKLGMTQKTWAKTQRVELMVSHQNKQTISTYKALSRTARFKDHNRELISTWVHSLRGMSPMEHVPGTEMSKGRSNPDQELEGSLHVYLKVLTPDEQALMQESLPSERELFYSLVRSAYWEMKSSGMLPDNSKAVLRLLNSVDWAELHSDLPLCDFSRLVSEIQCTWFTAFREGLIHMEDLIKIKRREVEFDLFDIVTFLDAHEAALRHAAQLQTANDPAPLRAAMAQVMVECREQVVQARRFLSKNNIGEDYMSMARTMQLALHLLFGAKRRVHELIKMGAASDADLHEFHHALSHDMSSIFRNCRHAMWKDVHEEDALDIDCVNAVRTDVSERGEARNSRYDQTRASLIHHTKPHNYQRANATRDTE